MSENTHYIKVSGYSATTYIYIKWDDSRLDFEPYVKHEYNLGDELRTNPLISARKAKDTKIPSGLITRNIGNTLLSSLTWTARGEIVTGLYTFTATLSDAKVYPLNTLSSNINIISDFGEIVAVNGVGDANAIKKVFVLCTGTNTTIYVCNTTNTNPVTNTNSIYYELATPTTEQGTPFPSVIEVDDFGTMGYAGTGYNGYPQGCEFFYPADYVLFIDSLGNAADFDASKIALKTDLDLKELDSQYIGAISSSEIVESAFYRNSIAITGGLTNAKACWVAMSNGAIYPVIINGGTSLVQFSGADWETSALTVTKVYYKE